MSATDLPASLIQQIEAAIAERGPGRKVGREIPFVCPAHDDQDPSARWNPDKHTWYCDVCGKKDRGWYGALNLARLLGIDLPERPRADQAAATAPAPRVVRTFTYHNADGTPAYCVDRVEPGPNGRSKVFKQRLPHVAAGDFRNYGLDGTPPLLYRLPELLAADPAAPVLIPEGEKHVDLLRSWGHTATCNTGGAGKFRPDDAERLRGRTIVILADHDDAGRRHADQVGALCRGIATEIRELRLPGLDAKGDVVDWHAAGGTPEQFADLLATAPLWVPPADADLAARVAELEARLAATGDLSCPERLVAAEGTIEDLRGQLAVVRAERDDAKATIRALRAAIANDRLGPERFTAIAAAFATGAAPDHIIKEVGVDRGTGEVLTEAVPLRDESGAVKTYIGHGADAPGLAAAAGRSPSATSRDLRKLDAAGVIALDVRRQRTETGDIRTETWIRWQRPEETDPQEAPTVADLLATIATAGRPDDGPRHGDAERFKSTAAAAACPQCGSERVTIVCHSCHRETPAPTLQDGESAATGHAGSLETDPPPSIGTLHLQDGESGPPPSRLAAATVRVVRRRQHLRAMSPAVPEFRGRPQCQAPGCAEFAADGSAYCVGHTAWSWADQDDAAPPPAAPEASTATAPIPSDEELDDGLPFAPAAPACPSCGRPVGDDGACWPCDDRPCVNCGASTQHATRPRCLLCDLAAERARDSHAAD